MPRYRVTIRGTDAEAMADLVRRYHVPVFDHHARRPREGQHAVGAILTPDEIEELERVGYNVERHEDVDEAGSERQAEVGQGNRYARQLNTDEQDGPRG